MVFRLGLPFKTVVILQASVILYLCVYMLGKRVGYHVIWDYSLQNQSLPSVWEETNSSENHGGNVLSLGQYNTSTWSSSKIQNSTIQQNKYKHWKTTLKKTVPKDVQAITFLELYEKNCSKGLFAGRQKTDGTLPLCPCVSPLLKGKLNPAQLKQFRPWIEIERTVGKDVRPGGCYRPSDCLPRLRIAIIIPFRDREIHLRTIMLHLHPVLQRQLLEYRIFVVEQNLPVIFNKASMMNIGYIEAGRLWPEHDCVVFHDVDMLMEDDRSLFYCGEKPVHMGCYTDKFHYKMLYDRMFGGVLSFTRAQFETVNGFSNKYFGWGGEDDDMWNRVKSSKLGFVRPPRDLARYKQLKHPRDKANPNNLEAVSIGAWKVQPNVYKIDGVKQVKYALLELKEEALYTWLHVDLDTSNLQYKLKESVIQYNYTSERGNCPGFNLLSKSVSLVTCRFRCDMDIKCRSYVFDPTQEISCILKYRICKTLDDTVISATTYTKSTSDRLRDHMKFYEYITQTGDCVGGDIEGLRVTSDECEAYCDENDSCVAYQFTAMLDKTCWLKKVCDNITEKEGLTIHVKSKMRTKT